MRMRVYLLSLCAAMACWLVTGLRALAASNALIVIGTTGSPSVTEDLDKTAQTIHDALVARGFAAEAVEVLKSATPADRITAERVLASLKKRQTLATTDEFWLVLLGFSGRSDEGLPTFQVSGPRLTSTDLKSALDAIPAKQFVFVGTSDSGGYIAKLLSRTRTVLAATREEGEIDLPRFPEGWAQALQEKPDADWKQIAARAAEITDKIYTDGSLAEGEHARLGDSDTGRVLEAPFGADKLATAASKSAPSGPAVGLSAADIKVEIHKPNSEWEKQPATPETKKLVEDARNAPNPEGFNAVMLEQRLGFRIGDDRVSENFVLQRIYLSREDGVARWANFMLPQDPPAVSTKLEAARIIQPDGSSTVFNPAKLPSGSNMTSGMMGSQAMVFFPDAHAGCLIEIAFRTRRILEASSPEFSQSIPVQEDIPVLKTELQLTLPEQTGLHYKLTNSDAKPVEAIAKGQHTLTWQIGPVAAYEALPYDPPAREIVTSLDVSSLPSWEAFATWYRRLTRGSDAQDDAVKAKAEELASGAATRMDKIRRAFEFVSALRYVAIEFGINGIRPRTPAVVLQNRYGDCKDKANLLVALLSDMGIEGRFCLVNRFSSTDVSFPSWQFNHAIMMVPKSPANGQPDDLWLDTTDSTAPFPTLSPGDIGRQALVFDKEKAEFHEVVAAGKGVTEIQETWKMKQKADGAWNGSLKIDWAGLAEYEARSSVRGASPRQRDYTMQKALDEILPGADFSNLNLTPADDLSIPLKLETQVTIATTPNPQPGFLAEPYFVAPLRDRPLLINNGQKLHLIQTVEFAYDHGDPAAAPAPFDKTVGGLHAKTSWQKAGDHTWRRTAEIDVTNPEIPQTDYAAARQMLRDWTAHLMP